MVPFAQPASVYDNAPQCNRCQNKYDDECYYNNKMYALAGLFLLQRHLSLLRLELHLILFSLAVALAGHDTVLDDRGTRDGLEGMAIVAQRFVQVCLVDEQRTI